MSRWNRWTAERLPSGSFWQVLVAHLMFIRWCFLKPKNHPLENWELVSGSSLVKICFSCRRNHHPFTFNPFFQSFVFHEWLRFRLWVLCSPVKVHSLASFATFSNLFLIFHPTHHQFWVHWKPLAHFCRDLCHCHGNTLPPSAFPCYSFFYLSLTLIRWQLVALPRPSWSLFDTSIIDVLMSGPHYVC